MIDIKKLINKSYKTDSCWEFCREIFSYYGIELDTLPRVGLKRIELSKATIPSIILFKCGPEWHSGVLWPDGLHFIHASKEGSKYVIRKESLTRYPWHFLVEGYYTYA